MVKLLNKYSWEEMWLDDKFVGLLIPVPGHWVATVNGKVIADEDKDKAIERALELWYD